MIQFPSGVLVLGHGDEQPGNALNSIASIDAVRASSADGIECDVRLTADAAIVLAHDDALVDGRSVSTTRLDDLPAGIPRLEEALDRCRGLVVNIEIKNFSRDVAFDPAERLAELVVERLAEREGGDRAVISCFGFGALDLIRARAPAVPTAVLLLSRRPASVLLDEVIERGHSIVHPYDTMVDVVFMLAARQRSLRVHVWTVPQVLDDRLRELVDLGVDGIITDDPVRALRAAGR